MDTYKSRMKPKPKIPPALKKISANSKYSHVKTVLETGYNVRKHQEALEEVRQNYKFRQDEIFRRITAVTLVTLLIEVSKLQFQLSADAEKKKQEEQSVTDSQENTTHQNTNETSHVKQEPEPREDSASRQSECSFISSVIHGVGELDSLGLHEDYVPSSTEESSCLLLDVRESDEYEKGHIISAKNYSLTRLSRAFNYETKDLLSYKNHAGRIIVLCDYDETIAPRCATTLIQRGYENVFMLSGGLKVACTKFPSGLITTQSKKGFTEEDIEQLEIYLEENLRNYLSFHKDSTQYGRSHTSTARSTLFSNQSAASHVSSRQSAELWHQLSPPNLPL